MGWSIDRTKDGESMSQQRETEKMRKISQASQVRYRDEKCFQRLYGEKLLISSTAVVANLLTNLEKILLDLTMIVREVV